jgi:hypothetical protein
LSSSITRVFSLARRWSISQASGGGARERRLKEGGGELRRARLACRADRHWCHAGICMRMLACRADRHWCHAGICMRMRVALVGTLQHVGTLRMWGLFSTIILNHFRCSKHPAGACTRGPQQKCSPDFSKDRIYTSVGTSPKEGGGGGGLLVSHLS